MSSGTETELVDRLALDTSAYSHFRHGHPLVDFAAAGVVLVPTTVLGDLEVGDEVGT